MKINIQILTSKDLSEFTELISVFEVVFEMDKFVYPDSKYLTRLLKNRNFIAVTAKLNSKVIAGMTVYILEQYYSEKPVAYIYDLAVLKVYQRQGVGKQLIEFLKAYCEKRGFEGLFVQADKPDDYAIDFYRKTTPTTEEPVVHFYYNMNKT